MTTYVDLDMRAVAGLERKIAIISCSSLIALHERPKMLRHAVALHNARMQPPKQREKQSTRHKREQPPKQRWRFCSLCLRILPSVRAPSRVVLCVSLLRGGGQVVKRSEEQYN